MVFHCEKIEYPSNSENCHLLPRGFIEMNAAHQAANLKKKKTAQKACHLMIWQGKTCRRQAPTHTPRSRLDKQDFNF